MKQEYFYNINLDIFKVKVLENQLFVIYYYYREVDYFLFFFEFIVLIVVMRIFVLDFVYFMNISNNFNDVFIIR